MCDKSASFNWRAIVLRLDMVTNIANQYSNSIRSAVIDNELSLS